MITEEERRLIDDAVSAGRVQKIPFAVSSEPNWKWCERQKKWTAYDPRTGKKMPPRWWVSRHFNKPKNPAVVARRERVRELAATMTVQEIVEATGINEGQVRSDLGVLGVSAKRMQRHLTQREGRPIGTATIEPLRKMAAAGKTKKEAAEALGLTLQTVRRTAKANGIVFRISDAEKARREVKAARMRELPALLEKGMTRAQLAEHFGVSQPTIAKAVRDLRSA